jgi:hypothetical protein
MVRLPTTHEGIDLNKALDIGLWRAMIRLPTTHEDVDMIDHRIIDGRLVYTDVELAIRELRLDRDEDRGEEGRIDVLIRAGYSRDDASDRRNANVLARASAPHYYRGTRKLI